MQQRRIKQVIEYDGRSHSIIYEIINENNLYTMILIFKRKLV